MKKNIKNDIIAVTGALSILTAFLIPAVKVTEKARKETTKNDTTIISVNEDCISADYAKEDGLFDSDRVHNINLLISKENWEYMTSHATEEKYVTCDVEIDGELIENVSIRPKGNSSLSSISQQGSTHFSFKIEFDHNDPNVTYYGLDKLSLNNLGQDPSCMKDFMAYHLMNDIGVASPLSSYTVLQLNGVDFGLYLAVEAVEDSFCYRNYGEEYGQLYKPDSFGMDNIDQSAVLEYSEGSSLWTMEQIMDGSYYADTLQGDRVDILGTMLNSVFTPEQTAVAALKYIGDDIENYNDLWESSVFKTKRTDKERLLDSIEKLNNSDTPQDVLDVDSLIRYFSVQSFVNNYDSPMSLFVHNFYLHEQDGILSYVPWDYNLAFGSFTYDVVVSSLLGDSGFNALPDTGEAMDINMNMINYPIDTPLYSLEMEERPVLNALFSDPETLEQYHEVYNELLENCFENGKYAELYEQVYEYIRLYVEEGLTFYDISQFEAGSSAMEKYLNYRAESVRGQLEGTIPSTIEGQRENCDNLISTEEFELSDMADFASLVPVLNDEMITGVLDTFLQDDFDYNTNGAVEAIHYYIDHPTKLIGRIPSLMKVKPVRSMVIQKATPIISILALIITFVIVMVIFYKKRNPKNFNNAI